MRFVFLFRRIIATSTFAFWLLLFKLLFTINIVKSDVQVLHSGLKLTSHIADFGTRLAPTYVLKYSTLNGKFNHPQSSSDTTNEGDLLDFSVNMEEWFIYLRERIMKAYLAAKRSQRLRSFQQIMEDQMQQIFSHLINKEEKATRTEEEQTTLTEETTMTITDTSKKDNNDIMIQPTSTKQLHSVIGPLVPFEWIQRGNRRGCRSVKPNDVQENVFGDIMAIHGLQITSISHTRAFHIGYEVNTKLNTATNNAEHLKLLADLFTNQNHESMDSPTNESVFIGYGWIALIERGDCDFVEKVRHAQQAGAAAVVVGDHRGNGLTTMISTGK
jgi:hypothetical protein